MNHRTLKIPWVKLDIVIEDNSLNFKISNNKPEQRTEPVNKKGIGLTNVKKRLQLIYPGNHSLFITENEMSYDVVMRISLYVNDEKQKEVLNIKEREIYELA